MSTLKTIEWARELWASKGHIFVDTKYAGANKKHKGLCRDARHEFWSRATQISRDDSCPICPRKTMLSINDMHRLGDLRGLDFVEVEYQGTMVKHQWRCRVAGHLFLSKPNSIQQGSGCPECAKEKNGDTTRYSIEKMHELGSRTGNVFLDEEYLGVKHKHSWRCVLGGHEFRMKPNSLQQGKGCPECYKERHKKYKSEAERRLAKNLRSRLYQAVKHSYRAGSAVRDLGMSIAEFKTYVEARWWPGMSWGNYGNKIGKWNIDHIRPLWSFDLTKREDVQVACHYSNLQPLWHVDNMAKGGRLDWKRAA
jgi:rubrerythrin